MAARELTLDSKMRAFFRLSNFSHRYELNLSTYCGVGRCPQIHQGEQLDSASAEQCHMITLTSAGVLSHIRRQAQDWRKRLSKSTNKARSLNVGLRGTHLCRRPHASAPEALKAVQSALHTSPGRQYSGALGLARSLSRQLSSSSSNPVQNGLHGISGSSESPQHARHRGAATPPTCDHLLVKSYGAVRMLCYLCMPRSILQNLTWKVVQGRSTRPALSLGETP